MTFPYPYTGPIALYNNLPIEPGFYKPRMFFISDIVRGQTTIVLTTADVDYVVGQQVRLIIPPTFGCRQLNEQTGFVISLIDSSHIEININSVGADPFIPSSATTQAQIIAIGDVNTGVTNLGRTNNSTFIPGSFINISPL